MPWILRRRLCRGEHIPSLASTCKEALMQWRHGCLRTAMPPRYTVHPEAKSATF
ncbi:hypothetical protein [Colwellia hornerae]|uniref:hypothetical protein n=1 Tax=Colwellia hornerae TaxID=89402 RepID=UPI0014785B71|nr:hypothetical protein [Colwellia hornerae]